MAFRIANKTAFLSAKHGAWNFDMFQKWVEKIKRERKDDIAKLAEETLSKEEKYCSLFGDHKGHDCPCGYFQKPHVQLARKVLGKS